MNTFVLVKKFRNRTKYRENGGHNNEIDIRPTHYIERDYIKFYLFIIFFRAKIKRIRVKKEEEKKNRKEKRL